MEEEERRLLASMNAFAPLGVLVEGGGASSAKVNFSPFARSSCLYSATLSRAFLCDTDSDRTHAIPSARTARINIFERRFTLMLWRQDCRVHRLLYGLRKKFRCFSLIGAPIFSITASMSSHTRRFSLNAWFRSRYAG